MTEQEMFDFFIGYLVKMKAVYPDPADQEQPRRALEEFLRPRAPNPPALRFLHTKKPKLKPKPPTSTKPSPTPRTAPAAGAARPKAGGAPKSALSPARRFGPGAIIKYGAIPPPTFTLLPNEPDGEFLEVDGPVSKDCIDWWNGADETTRLVWLAWSHSADPRKAFEVYKAAKAAAAPQMEDARAAERRTYQSIVAKARAAKAAALDAAGRIGTNGAGTQH